MTEALDLMDIRNRFHRSGLLICFAGPFHQGLIAEIGTVLKGYLKHNQMPPGAAQNIFAVFVEQAQNVRNYVVHKEQSGAPLPDEGRPIMVVGRQEDDGSYFLRAGNLVADGDAAGLIDRIDRLRTLDKAALKAFYKEEIRKPRDPHGGGGAGVGLVDMARRSSRPLGYSLGPAEDGYQFFSLTVIV